MKMETYPTGSQDGGGVDWTIRRRHVILYGLLACRGGLMAVLLMVVSSSDVYRPQLGMNDGTVCLSVWQVEAISCSRSQITIHPSSSNSCTARSTSRYIHPSGSSVCNITHEWR